MQSDKYMGVNYTLFSTFVKFENFCKLFFSNACLVFKCGNTMGSTRQGLSFKEYIR